MIKLKILNLFKSDLPFILLFIVFACFYYDSVLDKGPMNVHVWRQTDCLSITWNYAEGASFFKPAMNCQLADNNTTGLTAGEFPILYYCVGMIWKFFGESYLSYRLFYLFILFVGLFAFYKSLRILLDDNFWATAISALIFTSPVYVVYGISFLTDIPAFSFILLALYFLLKYHRQRVKKLFFVSMAFFALAGLIKISSLIAFVFLLFIWIIELFSVKSLGNKKLFHMNKYEWVGFAVVLLLIISWYYYVDAYNTLHRFKYTFNSIYPIWNMERGKVDELFKNINNYTSYVFFSSSVLLALLYIGIQNMFLWKRIPVLAYLSSCIIPLGCFIYFLLWGPLLGIHDYYFSPFLIGVIGILLPFTWFLKTSQPAIFHGRLLKIFLGVFLFFNFLYCLNVVKLKTSATRGSYDMVRNHEFITLMQWTNWDLQSNWNRFKSMRPYVRQIGIKAEDKIISLPDQSFNISLYLVGQKGWSNFYNYSKAEDIENLVQKGAKYLFISDPQLLKQAFLAPFLDDKVGSYEGIEVFRLSKKTY